MKTLTERMEMKNGEVEDAHIITNTHLGFDAYDTLCLICAELNINLDNVEDSDFDSCAMVLSDFVKSGNSIDENTQSVWFS